MKKVTLLFSLVALVANLSAQTLDEVKNLMYYEKFVAAKNGLDKLIAATPNDANVVYQLSQWHIMKRNYKAANEVLESKLATTNNALLLKAGLAHVATLKGDNAMAKQLASDVMATAKTTDWPLMLAVGKAMGDLNGKQDDAAVSNGFYGYSILDKVVKTFTAKKFDANMFIPLGDCLVRTKQGGKAVNEYEKALGFTPNFAEAQYRVGLLMGAVNNNAGRDATFDKALQLDPNYGPIYKYKFFKAIEANNYTVAKDAYAKYASLTETSPEIESYTCDLIFLSKDYNGCISCVDNLINKQGANASARLFAVKAYAYDLIGDSTNAAKNIDTYFAKEAPENIDLANYAKKAAILAKFPERQAEAFAAFDMAIEKDTVASSKLNTAVTAGGLAAKNKNFAMALKYYEMVYTMKGDKATNVDIYNIANIYNTQKNYTKADEYYTAYTTKFPKDIYGFAQRAYIARNVDSLKTGSAKPQMEALLNMALLDTAKNKAYINLNYSYNAEVAIKAGKYADAAKQYEKMLEYNPGDEGIMKNIQLLQNAGKPQRPQPSNTGGTTPRPSTAPRPAAGTAPKTGTSTTPRTGAVAKPKTTAVAVAKPVVKKQ
jgi:tetratricopeptide (TPR) repeat protein